MMHSFGCCFQGSKLALQSVLVWRPLSEGVRVAGSSRLLEFKLARLEMDLLTIF